MASNPSEVHTKLIICTLLHSEALIQMFNQYADEDSPSGEGRPRFTFKHFHVQNSLLHFIETATPQTDCLLLENSLALPDLLSYLHNLAILIPVVVVEIEEFTDRQLDRQEPLAPDASRPKASATMSPTVGQSDRQTAPSDFKQLYHAATLLVVSPQLSQVPQIIDEAIAKFLQLSAEGHLIQPESTQSIIAALAAHSSLVLQQKRLAEKLKERLGYLGVYYKRNPAHFLRHMSHRERQELLNQLRINYRQIILSYFSGETGLNQNIDSFVNLAFFADVPVAQVVEIHMELMDEFSKQLKLEGRSDEILLDYRLTLIDTIAHLCEMYRRSIPREF